MKTVDDLSFPEFMSSRLEIRDFHAASRLGVEIHDNAKPPTRVGGETRAGGFGGKIAPPWARRAGLRRKLKRLA